MKKVILKQFGSELGHAIVEDDKAQEMIDIYLSNYKGLPERWEVLDPQNPVHNESQIIEEKTVVTQESVAEIPAVMNEQGEIVQEAIAAIPEVSHKEVKLKAEYTCESVDVPYEYLLGECISKRKSEYPTPEEFMNAFFDGGEAAIQALQAKRIQIKQKYPKP